MFPETSRNVRGPSHRLRSPSPMAGGEGYNTVGMPLPQQPVRPQRRLLLAVAISVIAHLAVLPFIARDGMFLMPKQPVRQAVSLVSTPRSQIIRSGPYNPQASSAGPTQQTPKLPPAVPVPEQRQKLPGGQGVSLRPTNHLAPEKAPQYLSRH